MRSFFYEYNEHDAKCAKNAKTFNGNTKRA